MIGSLNWKGDGYLNSVSLTGRKKIHRGVGKKKKGGRIMKNTYGKEYYNVTKH